ncbi:N utilization substance protein B [Terasakiispira papahanaumokuakeensis]|uniref:Transcription antitermination protein NusB n=1 Tax=Terasakiispira papahanaumokuakeensis TaxID=197479 RepID=A0A1E2VB85_9GAMM|nr:transcription antitermination factor NusB [Terasakiispira papahanaumokuakeensis]ODC04280.1 N utilization substance protein B [Terasakiispira papahanaumokuakeensis]
MSKGQVSKRQARSAARQLTLQALYQWQISGNTMADIEAQLRAAMPDDNLEPHEDIVEVVRQADHAYFHELAHGIVRYRQEMDEAFSGYLDRELDDLDPIEISILRLGSYEMIKRLDVPYRVVINEAVELAKRFGGTDSHKYVNGVLDKLAKTKRATEVQARRG